jgi:hypothetical protein
MYVAFHPFLFSIYPALFLYLNNRSFFPLGVLFSPLIITAIITGFVYSLLVLITRDKNKSAVITSFAMLSFFSYGYFGNLLWSLLQYVDNPIIGFRPLSTFAVWAMVMMLILFSLLRSKFVVSKELTVYLNYVSILLVGINIIRLGINAHFPSTESQSNVLGESSLHETAFQKRPDIYYIILDGYGRSDVIKEMYGYDNGEFIKSLKNMGFFVALRSSSNYIQTSLSLATSLNFDYIDNILSELDVNFDDRNLLNRLSAKSKISSVLSKRGYKVIGVSTGYYGARIKNVNIDVPSQTMGNEFESSLVYNTPYPVVWALVNAGSLENRASLHGRRILDAFSYLEDTSRIEGPKFIFVHILSPHPPFVFNSEGEFVEGEVSLMGFDGSHMVKDGGLTKEQYRNLYSDQAKFISAKTLEVVENIIKNSSKDPIIIIQGDHGPGSELDWDSLENSNLKERFSILNAYYFPDGGDSLLYNEISPVNSFRVLLNYYFGEDLELLPDKGYYSTWGKPYELQEVNTRI